MSSSGESSRENIDYLELEDLLEIGRAIISDFRVKEIGLLESAIARPRTTISGEDAYETFEEKAASLLHSLARNHSLVDGNKRLAWAATRIFCLMNGYEIDYSTDTAEQLVIGTAIGKFDVAQIVPLLKISRL